MFSTACRYPLSESNKSENDRDLASERQIVRPCFICALDPDALKFVWNTRLRQALLEKDTS